MLRRFFANGQDSSLPGVTVITELLAAGSDGERGKLVLKYLGAELPGDVRGYLVLGRELGAFHFVAVCGYGRELLELTPEHGPWRDPGPRLVGNLSQELFIPNGKELRSQLTDVGLHEARSTLVVPVGGQEGGGALVLHQHGGELFGEEALKLSAQWGSVLGEVIGLQGALQRTRRSLVEFTHAFVEAMEAQDFSQLGHARRVTSYALSLGRRLEPPPHSSDLYFAAMLHDIGKLGTGADLSLEDDAHPLRGANLVASSPLLAGAGEGIRSHHEHWDGGGFPRGLAGEDIPLLGRIIAVADAFDLLSSERGQALPMREVEKALEAKAGRELDPRLVTTFINILRQGKSTAQLGALGESDLPF
jgi:hypothetical protein